VATAAGGVEVTVRDLLTGGERLTIPVDLVVLVTGMVPAENADLTSILKLPVGRDGFYNEIHPKLRPVETTVDGVYIAGACQAPRSSAESVTSALAAVTQSAVILKKGYAELDPLVAIVHPEACDGCGECLTTCPYGAIELADGLATVSETACKGCGGCVPLCPTNALDLRGYTDAQITALIDGLAGEAVA
jgi:heterodisulfide reductase subunit A